MKTVIYYILREPLLHFLLLGSVLYLIYSTLQPQRQQKQLTTMQQPRSIHISKEELSLTQKQYEVLLDKNIDIKKAVQKELYKKKVLLKAAEALKLTQNDPTIEKIVLQKMYAILNAKEKESEPSEVELEKFYKKHLKDYSKKESLSLFHIHFDKLTKEQAKRFSQLLQNTNPKELNLKKEQFSTDDLNKKFGKYFTQQLLIAPKGEWLNAIPSKDGFEFVYINDYTTTQVYPFEDVEERVYRDLKKARKKENLDKEFKRLYKLYPQQKE